MKVELGSTSKNLELKNLPVGTTFLYGNRSNLYLKVSLASPFLKNGKSDGVVVLDLNVNEVKVWEPTTKVTVVSTKIVRDEA